MSVKAKNNSVLSFGELALDNCISVPASFFEEKGLPIGGVIPYDDDFHKEISSKFKFGFSCWGGSTGNAAKGLSLLGHKVGVLAAISDDEVGKEIFEGVNSADLENLVVIQEGHKSGWCFCCVHEDASRTMYGVFDDSLVMDPNKVDWEKVSKYGYVLFEGFQFAKPQYDEFLKILTQKVEENQQKIALILSEMFWVPTFKGRILDFLKHVSIITGNESEFKQLFGKDNREELLDHLQTLDQELVVMTMGPEGAWLITKEEKVWVSAGDQSTVVDSLAAGDFFTAGILYGYLNGYSLEVTGKIASMLALDVVSRFGNQASLEVKEKIEEYLKSV